MKVFYHFVLCAALLISVSAGAQTGIRIDRTALDVIDGNTYTLNDSSATGVPSFGVMLHNESSASFTDSIAFGYSITANGQTAGYITPDYNGSGIDFAWRTIQIAAQDSAFVSFLTIHFVAPKFVVGASTIVVWPIFTKPHIIALDSASARVTIVGPTGVTDPTSDVVKVYIADHNILVTSGSKNNFGSIRIYNVEGQLLISQPMSQYNRVPMDQYANGVYIVEVLQTDGKRTVYKVADTEK